MAKWNVRIKSWNNFKMEANWFLNIEQVFYGYQLNVLQEIFNKVKHEKKYSRAADSEAL